MTAKLRDTRKDFLHKLSTKVVNENQVIVVLVVVFTSVMISPGKFDFPITVTPENYRQDSDRVELCTHSLNFDTVKYLQRSSLQVLAQLGL